MPLKNDDFFIEKWPFVLQFDVEVPANAWRLCCPHTDLKPQPSRTLQLITEDGTISVSESPFAPVQRLASFRPDGGPGCLCFSDRFSDRFRPFQIRVSESPFAPAEGWSMLESRKYNSTVTTYCELQYVCHIVAELSIENAEMM